MSRAPGARAGKAPPKRAARRVAPPKDVAPWLAALAVAVPEPRCELDFRDPFELLIATQLSAQSTDAMVNKVTPELFRRWPGPAALAAADPAEVEAVLRPTGFFRQKTRHALETARLLVERHAGVVPADMAALTALPGVARKTANVVLGTAFGIPSGVTVDTHVFRVTARWGWQAESSPERVEPLLMKAVPQDQWPAFGHRVVLFGRYHCTARAPKCEGCPLAALCPAAGAPSGRPVG